MPSSLKVPNAPLGSPRGVPLSFAAARAIWGPSPPVTLARGDTMNTEVQRSLEGWRHGDFDSTCS